MGVSKKSSQKRCHLTLHHRHGNQPTRYPNRAGGWGSSVCDTAQWQCTARSLRWGFLPKHQTRWQHYLTAPAIDLLMYCEVPSLRISAQTPNKNLNLNLKTWTLLGTHYWHVSVWVINLCPVYRCYFHLLSSAWHLWPVLTKWVLI